LLHRSTNPSPRQIIATLNQNATNAQNVVREAIKTMPTERKCKCGSALAHSLITDFKLVPEKTKKILPPSSPSICPRRNPCPCSLLVRLHTMLSKVRMEKVERTLGGAATYFSVSASFFTRVNLVGIVGDDFDPKDEAILKKRSIDIEGLERKEGKCFFWAGR